MYRNRLLYVGLVILLSLVLLSWGCGAREESGADSSASSETPEPAQTEGAPAPPSGGDIIVDPLGFSLKENTSITSITYDQSTDLWIPSGFTGEITEITFDPGGGARKATLAGTVELHFPSSAQIKITPGAAGANDLARECRASSSLMALRSAPVPRPWMMRTEP